VGKSNVALPVAVDVGSYIPSCRREVEPRLRSLPQLRMKMRSSTANRCTPFDVSADHDAPAAVTNVPRCHQVLGPGTKLLGVGGRRRRALAPDTGMAGTQGRVADLCDRLAQAFAGDKTPPYWREPLSHNRQQHRPRNLDILSRQRDTDLGGAERYVDRKPSGNHDHLARCSAIAWNARRNVPWSTMRSSSSGLIPNSAHQSMKVRSPSVIGSSRCPAT
jgi:hypothetical protein